MQEQESRLTNLLKCLPAAKNSIIPHRIILRRQLAYKAHLEHITDFFIFGEGGLVETQCELSWIFDVTKSNGSQPGADNDTHPPLHHFRSHTLNSEDKYLQDYWMKCVASDIQIPHHTIRVFDIKGNLNQIINTGFLQDDNDRQWQWWMYQ